MDLGRFGISKMWVLLQGKMEFCLLLPYTTRRDWWGRTKVFINRVPNFGE